MRFFLCLHLTTLQSSILPSFLQLRCTEFLDLHFDACFVNTKYEYGSPRGYHLSLICYFV
ncbi:hypothetical protein GLYMA_02G197702v4 [Glycine max]|nr:hypothetical protein GLYMA_02G197702v4 [Glycine max]KAH1061183.1 hypothetical protein GYH30_004600 [Glycine max]